MATVPATPAWFSDQSETRTIFFFVVLATDILSIVKINSMVSVSTFALAKFPEPF